MSILPVSIYFKFTLTFRMRALHQSTFRKVRLLSYPVFFAGASVACVARCVSCGSCALWMRASASRNASPPVGVASVTRHDVTYPTNLMAAWKQSMRSNCGYV